MKILVIGNGAREHALCHAISRSDRLKKLFASPGNPGIAKFAECIKLENNAKIVKFSADNKIDLVIIGPETFLVSGLVDELAKKKIKAFGPTKLAARLESSKAFTKEICTKYDIPTASYIVFENSEQACEYVRAKNQKFPLVIKENGLAAGKGVTIAIDSAEAVRAINKIFATDPTKIVIEEFLTGAEVSFFVLANGSKGYFFSTAYDYKRAFDHDTGPNTGGMGSVSPALIIDEKLKEQIMHTIINPTLKAMVEMRASFCGILFAGLMLTASGPKLLEYNVRFGDPETQSMLALLTSDIIQIMLDTIDNKKPEITFAEKSAVTVIMATQGYPGEYAKNTKIASISQAAKLEDIEVYQAGTEKIDDELITTSGRSLAITAIADTVKKAREKAYHAIKLIDWPEGFYRSDIGEDK